MCVIIERIKEEQVDAKVKIKQGMLMKGMGSAGRWVWGSGPHVWQHCRQWQALMMEAQVWPEQEWWVVPVPADGVWDVSNLWFKGHSL